MLFQICISLFLMLNTSEDILKNFEEPSICRERNTMQGNGTIDYLINSILQNIFFYVQHKKETHTGL